MKFSRGKNWWKFNLTKNKAILYGPSDARDRDKDCKVDQMAIRIGTRRIKFSIQFNKQTKQWVFHWAGCISSDAPKTQHIDYKIVTVIVPEDYSL
jgi:hypothetical protein